MSTIRDNEHYVASTGFGLGNLKSSYQDIRGYAIDNTFQFNLEYQNGIDNDEVDEFNHYGKGVVHNWMDPEYYVLTISASGGLPAWSYSDVPGDDMDANLQWTITGWGQTVTGGTIESGKLVVTTNYRHWHATGSRSMEILAYTFTGGVSDIGSGTQFGVELRT
jgi:hypothetical protein|tara:strand:- start:55 stop:546 length:492 start_codon:yes stop_codon:yes gene_type:complete